MYCDPTELKSTLIAFYLNEGKQPEALTLFLQPIAEGVARKSFMHCELEYEDCVQLGMVCMWAAIQKEKLDMSVSGRQMFNYLTTLCYNGCRGELRKQKMHCAIVRRAYEQERRE